MWTPSLLCQMICTLVPLVAFPRDPQELGETRDDQPPRGTEGTGAGAMELQQVVVQGVLHVCFFFTPKAHLEAGVLCVACFPQLARPACHASALPLEERRDIFLVLQKLPPATKVTMPNNDAARPQKALQRVRRAWQGAMVVPQVSRCVLWCHCRLRVMPVWFRCASGIRLGLCRAGCTCYAL